MRPILVLAVISVACATTSTVPLNASSTAVLARVPTDPEAYGRLIYEGRVFPLRGEKTTPTYVYQRRVSSNRSTSFTREGDGPVLVEIAEHAPDYTLQRFTEYQLQLDQVREVTVKDGVVEFRVLDGRTQRVAREPVSQPVVVGPTLYGFVHEHWTALLAGQEVPFRFAVPERLETVGFSLHQVPAPEGQVRLRMEATSPLIKVLVEPIFLTYTAAGALVALDGRVPTKLRDGTSWKDFDAHVEYANLTERFE